MEKVIQFLQDLAVNNNREWFNENRKRYEECRNKVLFLTEVLNNEIAKFDPNVPPMNPKDCMFRIFRDIRFSKNKQPYKTNFGSFIAKGGRKSNNAGYYFHIEPERSFIGGGVYRPEADSLKAIRLYIEQHADEFVQIMNDKNFKKYFPVLYDDKLKTAPKGFPKDHKHIDILRYKSFAFSHEVDNKVLTGSEFIAYAVDAYKQLYKMNAFLNEALKKSDQKV